MNPRALQDLIKNLRVFYRCPSCDADYREGDIRFLGKVEQHCFIQLHCAKCSLPVLATVLLSIQPKNKRTRRKIQRPSLGHDTSRKERSRFKDRGAITAHEIADFYAYLQALS